MSVGQTFQPLPAHAAGSRQVRGRSACGLRQGDARACFMRAHGKAAKQRLYRHAVTALVQDADHPGFRVMPQGDVQNAAICGHTQGLTIPMREGRRTGNLGTRRVTHG